VAAIGVNDMTCCRMYDVEHVEPLGHDVVLVAVPMGYSEPFTSSTGTAFPGAPALGALLVAMDRQSSTHPRQDPKETLTVPLGGSACIIVATGLHALSWALAT